MESKGGGLILSPDGSVECFDAWCALDQELQNPVHKVLLPHNAVTLSWSEKNFYHNEVNEAGSRLCGMPVKGDCFIVHPSMGGEELLGLLKLPAPSRGSALHRSLCTKQGRQQLLLLQEQQQRRQQEQQQWRQQQQQQQQQLQQQQLQRNEQQQGREEALQWCSPPTLPSSTTAIDEQSVPCTPPLAPPVPPPCLKPLTLHDRSGRPRQHHHAKHHHAKPPLAAAGPGGAAQVQQQPRAQEHPTPLEEQPPHPQPEVPCWTDLPPEIVSLVYQALPKEFSACLPLMQTCKAFRQVALSDHQVLMRVWFNLPDVRRPLKRSLPGWGRAQGADCAPREARDGAVSSSDSAGPARYIRPLLPLQAVEGRASAVASAPDPLDVACEHLRGGGSYFNLSTSAATDARGSKRVTGGPQWALHSGLVCPSAHWAGMACVPAPLARAAHYGNPSACGVMAQLLEVNGQDDCDVLLYWRRSAKYGDVEAMLKLGFALYEGTCGCVVDVDAAHAWLSKAVRVLLGGLTSLSQLSVDLIDGTLTISAQATPVVAAAADRAASVRHMVGPATGYAAGCDSGDGSRGGSGEGPASSDGPPDGAAEGAPAAWAQEAWVPAGGAAPVLTQGGLIVPGQPYTGTLLQLLKVGASIDQRAFAAVTAAQAASSASPATTASRRLRRADSQAEEGMAEGQQLDVRRERAQELEEEQQRRRRQREEAELARRRLKRLEGQCEVARVAWHDPALMPLLARAAELLAYIYMDGEAGIKADQIQACVLFKLAALAGSREAARALGWMYSTGQYGS